MTTTFNRMDVVMVKDHLADDWHLGLVNRDFNPGDFGVICEAKTSPNCSSFMAGGTPVGHVRLATETDIAAAPDFARDWLQREHEREQQRLLNQRDPIVLAATRRGTASLRAAGVTRISDLARFTDQDLLALKGVGKSAVAQWRQQAALLQEAAAIVEEWSPVWNRAASLRVDGLHGLADQLDWEERL